METYGAQKQYDERLRRQNRTQNTVKREVQNEAGIKRSEGL
jgi:hypothetical protein